MNEYRVFIPGRRYTRRGRDSGLMSFWTARRANSPTEAIQEALLEQPAQFQDGDVIVVIDVGPSRGSVLPYAPANGSVHQYRIEKPAPMRAVPV